MISNEKREEIEKQAEKLLGFRVWKNEESATGFKYQEQIWVDHCRPAMANEIKSWQTVISLLDRLSKARETLEKYADSSYWNNPLGFVVRENGNAKVGKELACDCLAEIGGDCE